MYPYNRKPTYDKMPTYLAVGRGRQVGIFTEWDDCWDSVRKFPGARYKAFDTWAEAQDFIAEVQAEDPSPYPVFPTPSNGKSKRVKPSPWYYMRPENGGSSDEEQEGCKAKPWVPLGRHEVVYTNAACKDTGGGRVKVGYGVFWGDGNSRNIAAPLLDGEQSNKRAELKAVNEAIKSAIAGGYNSLTLKTDSKLIADTYNQGWLTNWENNEWRLRNGSPVKDQDLMKEFDSLVNGQSARIRVHVEHITGRGDGHGNACADRLAKEGLAMQLK